MDVTMKCKCGMTILRSEKLCNACLLKTYGLLGQRYGIILHDSGDIKKGIVVYPESVVIAALRKAISEVQ